MWQLAQKNIIEEEKLALLLGFNAKTSFSNSFLAVLLAYVQADVLPRSVVLTWLSAVLVLNAIRFFIGQYYLSNPVKAPNVTTQRLMIFRAGLIACAMLWSVSSFLVSSDHLYEQQLFVVYMLAGLTAGAAMVYSIDIVCGLAFTFISLVPALVLFSFSDDKFLIGMAISGFVYIVFITGSLRVFNRRLIDGILSRLEVQKNAEEVRQLAFYDVLTGLPNRRLLLERLDRAVIQSWRTGKRGALLFLDLDHFKKLNDKMGHHMGDALLVQVALRLQDSVRKSDTVARFGGDEFVLLLEHLNEQLDVALQEVHQITRLIIANLNEPYHLKDVDYLSTPSIGVALFGEHGGTQQELLKHADIAMYHAKKSGRNQVSVYNERMQKAADIE